MIKYSVLYDISVILGEESIDYPGDTPYVKETICTIKDSGIYDLSKLEMSTHSGTHIDTPAHFIKGAGTLDSYTVQDFILPAQVVAIEDKEAIRSAELKNLDIETGKAILFKTDNSVSGRCKSGVFSKDFVYLTEEASEYCVELNCLLVGIDYITIERYGDDVFPAHRKILGNNILVLEGINLKGIPPGKYTLMCLPLRIKGAEASPVRAILFR
jgi:arylformamidase